MSFGGRIIKHTLRQTPEEDRRVQRPKCCAYNSQDDRSSSNNRTRQTPEEDQMVERLKRY